MYTEMSNDSNLWFYRNAGYKSTFCIWEGTAETYTLIIIYYYKRLIVKTEHVIKVKKSSVQSEKTDETEFKIIINPETMEGTDNCEFEM